MSRIRNRLRVEKRILKMRYRDLQFSIKKHGWNRRALNQFLDKSSISDLRSMAKQAKKDNQITPDDMAFCDPQKKRPQVVAEKL
jgi:hypothetical protein